MRLEWLFLRWLAIIGAIVAALVYLASHRPRAQGSHYQTIQLVQSSRSWGPPVAGILVNPAQRDVSAVIGKPASKTGDDFFIVWKTKDGATYSTTFPGGDPSDAILTQISPDGQTRLLYDLGNPSGKGAAASDEGNRIPAAEAHVRSILDALPAGSGVAGPQ